MTYAEAEVFLFDDLTNYFRTGSVTPDASVATPTARVGRNFLPTRSRILSFLFSLGNPHAQTGIRYVHVAGTNAKGTVSTGVAAMAQAAGLRTGLSTSPHYASFRERIRVDGKMIEEAEVVAFVEDYADLMLSLRLSFFEAAAGMAFWYFAKRNVELAVLEVGLGGTWDASNVIAPVVSVITNIDFDHQEVLGHTLSRIAAEKAGVIKAGRPLVIGKRQEETHPVFSSLAAGLASPIYYAEDLVELSEDASAWKVLLSLKLDLGEPQDPTTRSSNFESCLRGPFEAENLTTILAVWRVLAKAVGVGFESGFPGLATLDSHSYMGRFQIIEQNPEVIIDAGHNPAAWSRVLPAVCKRVQGNLLVVCGFKRGKNCDEFFRLLPASTWCCITEASVLPERTLAVLDAAIQYPHTLVTSDSVGDAFELAMQHAKAEDTIFVGGSSFVVGDLLAYLAGQS